MSAGVSPQDRESRPAALSPSTNHRNYNRHKYYSALRTGYKHLANEDFKEDFLATPEHVIDQDLFIIWWNPFAGREEQGKKQSSLVIIFSCWKTMIGSAVVSLPWAF
jgi:solute carrier family 38 (sodium-coupled neutral amino acid transporter), member 9